MILNRIGCYLESRGLYPEEMMGFKSSRCVADNVVDFVTSVEQDNFEHKTTTALFLYKKEIVRLSRTV